MARTRVFIGSSSQNKSVAELLAEELEEDEEVDVKVWDDDVFQPSQGVLETLLGQLEEFEFAAFVLAPDDLTTSKEVSQPSPRDNVLFEIGLFMGVLGRERVFLVFDQTAGLKIPSDLAGIVLVPYDGSRIQADPKSAIRKATRLVLKAIAAPRYQHLVGKWKSHYPMTFQPGAPMVDEVIEIRPGRVGLSFDTVSSSHNDFYTATGRLLGRQITGHWRSRADSNSEEGVFILIHNPSADIMYGYFTSPDENGAVVFGTWLLAKMTGTDEGQVQERLESARELLTQKTIRNRDPSNSG